MKHHNPSKGPSQRQRRVGEQIRHIVVQTLQRRHFSSEALLDGGNITVSEVRPSPDLKNATVYVHALGGGDMTEALDALNQNSQVFQKAINSGSNLKFTPRVRFVKDESFSNASRIDELLSEINIPDDGPTEDE